MPGGGLNGYASDLQFRERTYRVFRPMSLRDKRKKIFLGRDFALRSRLLWFHPEAATDANSFGFMGLLSK